MGHVYEIPTRTYYSLTEVSVIKKDYHIIETWPIRVTPAYLPPNWVVA